MSAGRLRNCLEALGWSLRHLARVLDINFTTVRRWAAGTQEVPPPIAAWLEILARCHETNPPPARVPPSIKFYMEEGDAKIDANWYEELR
jgi:transcriptional regulator with XRE-family HTH domain